MTTALYQLPILDTIKQAWHKTAGAKRTIWAAIAMMFLVVICLGVAMGITKALAPSIAFIVKGFAQLVIYFMQMGLLYIGIKRAEETPIHYRMIFRAFNWTIALNIVLLYVIQLIIYLPVILLMILGTFIPLLGSLFYFVAAILLVYLSIRISLSMAFVLDQSTHPWEAIKLSFRATQSNALNLFAIFTLQFMIVLISIIPLFLGLIWTIPFGLICYGTIYKSLRVNTRG